MKVLVTGVNGQLGNDVMLELKKRNIEAIGCDITKKYSGINASSPVASMPYFRLDITDMDKVFDRLKMLRPDAVIHCAAYTAVDNAQEEENYDTVMQVNYEGTRFLASACKDIDAKLLYLSTDYVFDGSGESPHSPDDMNFSPLNIYGLSKLKGEEAIRNLCTKYFIVRISWVFGLYGSNFIKTMLNVAKTHDTVRVVNDQIGMITGTYDLSSLLVDMILSDKYGIYHATNSGDFISWYDLTCKIYEYAALDTKIIPVSTEEYGLSKAKRPYNSRLDISKLEKSGFKPLPNWQDSLKSFIDQLTSLDLKN